VNALRRLAAAVLLALPLAVSAQWGTAVQQGGKRDPMQHFFVPSLGDYPAELAEARAAGKQGLFAMYTWDDCPYCARMMKNVLSLPQVQDYYRERFLTLAVDTRGAVPITDFNGRVTTEKAFSTDQNVRATPTFIFYDPYGRQLYRHVGEIKDAATMIRLADFVSTGSYKSQKFAEFQNKRTP
jgi:thioredoxin-related protein